jgi:hypothetical protein
MSGSEVAVIELPVCQNDGSRVGTESLEAEQLSSNRYRLLYSPGVVEGVAKNDVIELSDTDPKGFVIVARSGFLCVWFYFSQAGVNRGPDGERVRAAVEEFGGVCDGGGNTHLVFSIPVSLGFPAVEALLDGLVGRHPGSSWLFGNVYDPWDEFKPLGWWETSKT